MCETFCLKHVGGVKQNEDKVIVPTDGLCLGLAAQYTNWLERVWLEPLSYEERLQDQGSFGQEKEWFGEHSTASWALMEGMEKTELGSSQQCMVRG